MRSFALVAGVGALVLGSPLAAFDPRLDLAVLVVVGCILLAFGAHRFNKIEI